MTALASIRLPGQVTAHLASEASAAEERLEAARLEVEVLHAQLSEQASKLEQVEARQAADQADEPPPASTAGGAWGGARTDGPEEHWGEEPAEATWGPTPLHGDASVGHGPRLVQQRLANTNQQVS